MIVDRLSNAGLYANIHPLLERGLQWLAANALESWPTGKTAIEGERLFALVQDYTTKPAAEAKWEAHRRYWDVQLVVIGEERLGCAPLGTMAESSPYQKEHDIAWFTGTGDLITLRAGSFCILAPHDVHAPGLALSVPARVRKVVLKVEL